MCEKCINICNCNCKNYQITYDVWLNKWYCKKCKCEVDNKLIEKICINCNKPVTNCECDNNDASFNLISEIWYCAKCHCTLK